MSSVTEDSRLKISSSVPWQQPCVPELMFFFLWTSMSPHNMGMRRSQRKSVSVLSSSWKMLHPLEFPDFRQVVTAKNEQSWGSSVVSADPAHAVSAVLQWGRQQAGSSRPAPSTAALLQALRLLPRAQHRPCKKMEPGVNETVTHTCHYSCSWFSTSVQFWRDLEQSLQSAADVIFEQPFPCIPFCQINVWHLLQPRHSRLRFPTVLYAFLAQP